MVVKSIFNLRFICVGMKPRIEVHMKEIKNLTGEIRITIEEKHKCLSIHVGENETINIGFEDDHSVHVSDIVRLEPTSKK